MELWAAKTSRGHLGKRPQRLQALESGDLWHLGIKWCKSNSMTFTVTRSHLSTYKRFLKSPFAKHQLWKCLPTLAMFQRLKDFLPRCTEAVLSARDDRIPFFFAIFLYHLSQYLLTEKDNVDGVCLSSIVKPAWLTSIYIKANLRDTKSGLSVLLTLNLSQ